MTENKNNQSKEETKPKNDQFNQYLGDEKDFWDDNEPIIQVKKNNLLKFIIIKSLTMLLISYMIFGYTDEISYFFSSGKVIKLGKLNINTVDNINIKDWEKYSNKEVSIAGWVEVPNSFSMKLNFTRYQILKLWRKPVFVAIEKGKKGLVAEEGASNDIPYIYEISGRLLTYDKIISGISLLNPYKNIVFAYRKATKRKFPKDAILIIAHEIPKSNYWSIAIPILLMLYLLYSIFSIFRIFKSVKKEK